MSYDLPMTGYDAPPPGEYEEHGGEMEQEPLFDAGLDFHEYFVDVKDGPDDEEEADDQLGDDDLDLLELDDPEEADG